MDEEVLVGCCQLRHDTCRLSPLVPGGCGDADLARRNRASRLKELCAGFTGSGNALQKTADGK